MAMLRKNPIVNSFSMTPFPGGYWKIVAVNNNVVEKQLAAVVACFESREAYQKGKQSIVTFTIPVSKNENPAIRNDEDKIVQPRVPGYDEFMTLTAKAGGGYDGVYGVLYAIAKHLGSSGEVEDVLEEGQVAFVIPENKE